MESTGNARRNDAIETPVPPTGERRSAARAAAGGNGSASCSNQQ